MQAKVVQLRGNGVALMKTRLQGTSSSGQHTITIKSCVYESYSLLPLVKQVAYST